MNDLMLEEFPDGISTHELAHQLLKFPDIQVKINYNRDDLVSIEEWKVLASPIKDDVGYNYVCLVGRSIKE